MHRANPGPHPPRAAQALLRWSLPVHDRAVVLGDVEEEFESLAHLRSPATAARWYWWQTLTSLGPNLGRRLQRSWRKSRRVVDEDDRQRRRMLRNLSLWVCAGGSGIGALAWRLTDDPVGWALGGPFVAVGLLMLAASQFRPRRYRAASSRRQTIGRFSGLSWLAILIAMIVTRAVTTPAPLLGAWLLVWFAVDVWPERWWPIRQPGATVQYFVRTPLVAGYRARHLSFYGTTSVPSTALAMTEPILGRDELVSVPAEFVVPGLAPMKATIARTFTSDDTLRLFAAVSADPATTRATLEIRDTATGESVRSEPATIAAATRQPPPVPIWAVLPADDDDDATPVPPLGEIHAIAPLAGLVPGRYVLRLIATNGAASSHQDTDIVVRAGTDASA